MEQARHNGDDLAAVKTRLDRVETRLDQVESELRQRRRDLPAMIAETMREVLREREGR